MMRLRGLLAEARDLGGVSGPIRLGSFCLAGADFPNDLRLLRAAIAQERLADRVEVRNDAFAALRAGAPARWGIAVICGSGVNAVGVAPDGRTARLAGMGQLSGDWGGGHAIGMDALGAAVRASDGRGAPTSLRALVPRALDMKRPVDVTRAIYDGTISNRRLEELAPVVFAAAAAGDRVARSIVDRLADELAIMAMAIARRLRVVRAEVDVVLAGGVFRAGERGFSERIEERLAAAMPRARIRRLVEQPVLGAALLGLDGLGARRADAAERRLRDAFAGRDALG